MLSPLEIQAVLERLDFVKSHTAKCRRSNSIKRYDVLKRKTCTCSYYACGVHETGKGFERRPTGEITLEKAQEVVRRRIETGNAKANLGPDGIPIQTAIDDFMSTVRAKERTQGTLRLYGITMGQLALFARHTGYLTIQKFDQDAMKAFFDSWSDPNAPYKAGTRYTTLSIKTAKRKMKTMRLFFRRCILRKWITEDPSIIIELKSEPIKNTREQVKYLTEDQIRLILKTVDVLNHGMTGEDKNRLKAVMLLMRWTGLRISDAAKVRLGDIKGDVLHVITKKSKVPVQLPLPADLMTILNQLTPYDYGYFFFDPRSTYTTPVEHSLGITISKVFQKAGIKEDGVWQTTHRFRNSFAVHLLSKGVPLETVSLMLGHQNVQTTENYYADYSQGYMDRAERMLRKVWTLKDDETL